MLGVEPNIRDEFIRTGKVKMVFNHILDFAFSPRASQAAECAGDQGQFWEMHDKLFAAQGDLWGRFDRFGGWLEGPLRQCDPQMCIWLAGLALVEARSKEQAA